MKTKMRTYRAQILKVEHRDYLFGERPRLIVTAGLSYGDLKNLTFEIPQHRAQFLSGGENVQRGIANHGG